jgi:Uncharacterized protein conserved in bacteria (DUF2252)
MKTRTGALRDEDLLPASDRLSAGKALRSKLPRLNHAAWRPPSNREDPLAILRAADVSRVSDLVLLRYGRMLQWPFTFFRGSAAVMAADLVQMPVTGIRVQACGDAHLLNFAVL